MENKIEKPELLIVSDKELVDGFKAGYYPDLTRGCKNGTIKIMSLEECKKNNFPLPDKASIDDGFYMLNPYSDRYLSILDEQAEASLRISHALAIKEAFVRMGAKSIKMSKSVEDIDNDTSTVHIGGKNLNSDVALDCEIKRDLIVKVDSVINFNNPNNTARPIDSIKKYINSHGLYNDFGICCYVQRLEEDGILSGEENYEFTFFHELKNACDVVGHANFKILNMDMNFNQKSSKMHRFKTTLSVKF